MSRKGSMIRRSSALAGAILLASMAAAVNAHGAGLEFGPRIGYARLDGDLLDGHAQPDDLRIFGCQLRFNLSTGTTLELAGEATSDKFDFEDVAHPDQLVSGRAKWEDLAVYASLHFDLLHLGPISAYAGGGAGLHFNKIDVIESAPSTQGRAAAPTDEVDDWLHKVEKDRSDVEWHGVGGAQLDLGASPISIFGEGRYRDITGDHGLKGWAGYAGFNLRLE